MGNTCSKTPTQSDSYKKESLNNNPNSDGRPMSIWDYNSSPNSFPESDNTGLYDKIYLASFYNSLSEYFCGHLFIVGFQRVDGDNEPREYRHSFLFFKFDTKPTKITIQKQTNGELKISFIGDGNIILFDQVWFSSEYELSEDGSDLISIVKKKMIDGVSSDIPMIDESALASEIVQSDNGAGASASQTDVQRLSVDSQTDGSATPASEFFESDNGAEASASQADVQRLSVDSQTDGSAQCGPLINESASTEVVPSNRSALRALEVVSNDMSVLRALNLLQIDRSVVNLLQIDLSGSNAINLLQIDRSVLRALNLLQIDRSVLRALKVVSNDRSASNALEVVPSNRSASNAINVVSSNLSALHALNVIPSNRSASNTLKVIPSNRSVLRALNLLQIDRSVVNFLQIDLSGSNAINLLQIDRSVLRALEVVPRRNWSVLRALNVVSSDLSGLRALNVVSSDLSGLRNQSVQVVCTVIESFGASSTVKDANVRQTFVRCGPLEESISDSNTVLAFSGTQYTFTVLPDSNKIVYNTKINWNSQHNVQFGIINISSLTVYKLSDGVYLIVIQTNSGQTYLSGYLSTNATNVFATCQITSNLKERRFRSFKHVSGTVFKCFFSDGTEKTFSIESNLYATIKEVLDA